MANRRFRDSETLFRQVSTDLTTLLDTKELVYQRLLESGENRLAEGDPDSAGELAERGLAIHPDSDAAASLARRAQARVAVLQQFERAEELEETGDLEQAAEILAEIMALDGTFQPAVSASARISRILEQRAFESRMTSLYNSIERGDFSEAEKSLSLLLQSRANDPLVIQAAQYYAEMSAAAVLGTQRRQAEQFAEAERWREALRVYQDILQENPGAMFAAAGVEKAARRLELDRALVETIAEPSRMQDREVRERAAELLSIAERTSPGGPRLQSQVEALQELVDWASREIDLTLDSDNQTDVTIYHVGNLGRFFSRTVKLVPGTYTILGSRPGYRDTRKTVKIGTKESITRLTITCSEPI
jgi:tetratricopeptide (TPR) repeat protein